MSSRALRKLQGRDNDLAILTSLANEKTSSEDESEQQESLLKTSPKNLFCLLNESDSNETEEKQNEPITEAPDVGKNLQPSANSSSRKKRKKKKKNSQNNVPQESKEDIDNIIKEMKLMIPSANSNVSTSTKSKRKKERYILAVEHRYLNPTNELKKIFGARTLMNDSTHRQRSSLQAARGTWLTAPSQNWPRMVRTGLSMDPVATEGSNKQEEFAFVHNRDYREVQYKFLDSVSSHDHNLIAELLRVHNYHIDSLLTLSDMFRMNDDSQTARDLIERALFCLESHFHSKFNMTTGNCCLSYRRPENRGLFLALYRHLHFVSQRGCHRTALELCKVLFNINSDEDPLCVLLFMDYFAIQAGEYEFLLKFCVEFEEYRKLSDLPNWAYSAALAEFELYQENNDLARLTESDTKLQKALIQFPYVLLLLLDKCSVEPDSTVSTHPFFNKEASDTSPDGLKLLSVLFACRNHSQWKAPEVMAWLEKNVRTVLQRVDAKEQFITSCRQKRRKYQKPPLNIYRYAKISEYPGISEYLPPEIFLKAVLSYDPLPPPDSIISYEPQKRSQGRRQENPLGLFFHSLLPNYNPNEPGGGEQLDLGAGLAAANGTLRNQIQNLMGAMRDLIGNMSLAQENQEENQPEDGDREQRRNDLNEPDFVDDEWD